VRADGGSDSNSGQCWEDAFETLDRALLDLHQENSQVVEIRIAQGTYAPSSANASFVIGKASVIQGGFRGFSDSEGDADDLDPSLYITTLSGDVLGNDDPEISSTFDDNSFHVILIDWLVDDAVKLQGLRIEDGDAFRHATCSERRGGGVRSLAFESTAKLEIFDCRFTGNRAAIGGAVDANITRLEVRRSVFEANEVEPTACGPSAATSAGGAINSHAELVVVRSRFAGNRAMGSGFGGAIQCTGSPFQVTNCEFVANTGGEELQISDKPHGGAIAVSIELELTGSLLVGNQANGKGSGGAVGSLPSSYPVIQIRDCTIADNFAAEECGGVLAEEVVVHNSIVWGNRDGIEKTDAFEEQFTTGNVDGVLLLEIEYSCVEAIDLEEFETGNSDEDPVFRDAGSDYRLAPASPALNTGSNAAIPADVTDVNEDFNVNENLPLSLSLVATADDRVRVLHNHVDMGAYEFGTVGCQADLNEDGVVDGDDLGTMLGQWGACPKCISDFNDDGVVDGDDLGTLLGEWGSCAPSFAGGGGGQSLMGGGSESLMPAAIAEEFGLGSIEELVEWLLSLDFETMCALLEGLFGE